MQVEIRKGRFAQVVALLAISLVINMALAFKLVETKISLDYSSMEVNYLQNLNERNTKLLGHLVGVITPEEFHYFLQDIESTDFIVKRYGDNVLVEQYEFEVILNKVRVREAIK